VSLTEQIDKMLQEKNFTKTQFSFGESVQTSKSPCWTYYKDRYKVTFLWYYFSITSTYVCCGAWKSETLFHIECNPINRLSNIDCMAIIGAVRKHCKEGL